MELTDGTEHRYRCVQCYIPTKRSVRNADTVTFFPHNIEFPKTTTLDYLKQASEDILHILENLKMLSLIWN